MLQTKTQKIIFYTVYWILSLSWGILQTVIGGLVAAALWFCGFKPFRFGPNFCFVVGESWGGLSLGPFIFVSISGAQDDQLLWHESGHGIQNIIYGIFAPFIVSIPSAIRYWYREYLYTSDYDKWKNLPDYDAIWFEGQATKWGTEVYCNI